MIAAQEVVFPAGTVRLHDVDGDGTAELQITNPSGGLLAGDRMDTELVLRPGVRASVVTQGANRVCGPAAAGVGGPVVGVPAASVPAVGASTSDSPAVGSAGGTEDTGVADGGTPADDGRRPGGPSPVTTLATTMTLQGDARLEWAPHHLVPYARSSVRQRTAVEVGPGAGLLAWESLSAGRSGRGERFAWAHLDTRMRLTRDGRPLLHDGAVLGSGGEPFDGADLVSTVVVVLPRERPAIAADGAPALAEAMHRGLTGVRGVLASASAVGEGLVVARVVARDAVALYAALDVVRGPARRALGLPPARRPVS